MTAYQHLTRHIKRSAILVAVTGLTWVSCIKKDNTSNNYYSLPAPSQTAFIIEGISNISFTNNVSTTAILPINVQYNDSAQEHIVLSLSPLPAGITIDPTWVTGGTPTFSTQLSLFDTNAAGATPGIYPMTLTATTASGVKKNYPFTIKVLSPGGYPVFGMYHNCTSSCDTSVYSDSIYVDPLVANKIWFTNFANSGNLVFGIITAQKLMIPAQLFSGTSYSTISNSVVDFNIHALQLYVNEGAKKCNLNMN